MTDNSPFSNQLQDDASLDSALADIEQAFVRFEQILSRHGRVLGSINGVKARRNSTKSIITSSLSRISGLFSGRGLPDTSTVFNPSAGKTNRFPTSGGQFLADLAASIQKIGGRNL